LLIDLKFPESRFKRAYDLLSDDLQAIKDQARLLTARIFEQDIDRMTQLQGKLWVYEYFIFVHRVRRHKFVRSILRNAVKHGFRREPEWEYASNEDAYAYTQAIQYAEILRPAFRPGLLKETESVTLVKTEQDEPNESRRIKSVRIPLLRTRVRDGRYESELVEWSAIRSPLTRL